MMEATNNDDELNTLLKSEYKALGIELPYSGDFDDFMNDTSSVLEFKWCLSVINVVSVVEICTSLQYTKNYTMEMAFANF